MNRKDRNPRETEEPRFNKAEVELANRETCRNPWNGKCSNTDVALYILCHGNCLPICNKCWKTISTMDTKWV